MGLFLKDKKFSKDEKLKLLLKHAKMFEDFYKGERFYILHKYFKIYCRDFEGSAKLRHKLMDATSYSDVAKLVGVAE